MNEHDVEGNNSLNIINKDADHINLFNNFRYK